MTRTAGIMLNEGDLDRVAASPAAKDEKIMLLWTVMQIDYRGPIGEHAERLLKEVVADQEVLSAFSQIVGFCLADPGDFIRLFNRLRPGILD